MKSGPSVTLKSYDILITCPEIGFAGTPPPDWLLLAIGAASPLLIGRRAAVVPALPGHLQSEN